MSKSCAERVATLRATADLLEANPWLFTPPEFSFDFGPQHLYRICDTAESFRFVVGRLTDAEVKHENLNGTLYVNGTVDDQPVMVTCKWDMLMPPEVSDDERRKIFLASLLAPVAS